MAKIKSAHFYPLARGILASSSLTARRLFLGVPANIISTNSVKKSLISEKKLSRHPLTLPLPRVTRHNFSSQYPYNREQTSDENREKHQQADYHLIQHQILGTNIT